MGSCNIDAESKHALANIEHMNFLSLMFAMPEREVDNQGEIIRIHVRVIYTPLHPTFI